MNSVIKTEYKDSWFAIPRLITERYMPSIGIRALALYTMLSSLQDGQGRITIPLIEVKNRSGLRTSKFVQTLEYLKDKKLVNDIIIGNSTRALEMSFKPQARKRRHNFSKK